MKKSYPMRKLGDVHRRVGGELRLSKRGVPHVVVMRADVVYSIAYFGTKDLFRVFYPYPSGHETQTRKDFKEAWALTVWLDDRTFGGGSL